MQGFPNEPGFDVNYTHFIVKDKAYTEDKILIHNICIFNVPRNLTPAKVEEYFSGFGNVSQVAFLPVAKGRRGSLRTGYVNFVDPVIAAKVLRKKHHIIAKGKRVAVKACDSWHQPMAVELAKEAATDCVKNDAATLLSLNDDCLALIFNNLSLKDKMNLSLAHSRFAGVVQMCSKREFESVDMSNWKDMSLWQIREFLRLFGSNMSALTFKWPNKYRDRIIDIFSRFCRNLKSLDIQAVPILDASLHNLLIDLPQITELKLGDCYLKDRAVLAMKQLPNLVTLSLAYNINLTGKYLNLLTTVQDLDLRGCSKMQLMFLTNAFRALTLLTTLYFQSCPALSSRMCQMLVRNCTKLERLVIGPLSAKYECLAQLPGLKHLELFCYDYQRIRAQIFTALVQHKSNQLEHLTIIGDDVIGISEATMLAKLTQLKYLRCSRNQRLNDACLRELAKLNCLEEVVIRRCNTVTHVGILSLLAGCTKLKKLDLKGCDRITKQFILPAITLLTEIRGEGSKPVEVNVRNTHLAFCMEDDDNEDDKCENHPFLKLGYDKSSGSDSSDDDSNMSDVDDFLSDNDEDFIDGFLDSEEFDDEDQEDALFHVAYDMYGG